MMVWSAVYMFDDLIVDMKVFPTIEAARKYFHDKIKACHGEIEDCDPDDYIDGENGNFYWGDGCGNEIVIWKIPMEA